MADEKKGAVLEREREVKTHEIVLLATYPVYCLVLAANDFERRHLGGQRWEKVETQRANKVQFSRHRGLTKVSSVTEISDLRRKAGYGIDWIIAAELRLWLKSKTREKSAKAFIRQMTSRSELASEGAPIDPIDVTEMISELKLPDDLTAMLGKAVEEYAVA